ncbi:hypothetical protein N7462_005560 [Penicillium macrosclerotiorum]|uniref:uncharacterized protein n=1 Tax=Penicillium macrosclerotiorum TaxID=303699 RepID=UPI0025497854|nr:uncharacterized protein N7462_005560 [Penicillium macrosclerotiorum]KAJ5682395.1 hypothetical protein N7462_005560 [Penicillium macrosclerotiorum]
MAETLNARDFLCPQEYYDSLQNEAGDSLWDKFKDIDDKSHFGEYMQLLSNSQTINFALDFGNDDAFCAPNLNSEEFQLLVSRPRASRLATRWIHIWNPQQQKAAIKAITTPYGVSERLQGLMCTDPVPHPPKSPKLAKKSQPDITVMEAPEFELDDIESQSSAKEKFETSAFQGLTFAHVTDQIWHFSSVDHGPRYTCIGYNTLFVAPGVPVDNGQDLPEGTRLWTWLVLCDDGTVISIQEDPLPQLQDLEEKDQQMVIKVVRRNILSIVSGISKQHANTSESESLVTVRVRHFNDAGPDQANIKPEDGPSLLLYYIFDDWVSSFGLVAKRQHKYGRALERLRGQMLDRPIVDLVNELHWLGRRLGVLKRLYQSYELIMRRLLQRQGSVREEARGPNLPPVTSSNSYPESEFANVQRRASVASHSGAPARNPKLVGVSLSSAAVGRFERLVDRINLYCLSEIDTCLLEKESLTFLNFNLIALKDSQAVEKLTRITILLAKATMLFLPVSLMTAYFSTELQGVKGGYTKLDYWASFAVIFVVTLAVLTIFGFASDTVEGKTIYRSLIKTFFQRSRQRISQQRRGGGHD